jgi:hypothetical protein
MMATLFVLLIWGLGFVTSTALLKGAASPVFFAWTGFLSGTVIWLIGSLILVVARIEYTPLHMVIWSSAVVLLAFALHFKRNAWKSLIAEWNKITLVLVLLVAVLVLFTTLSFAYGSFDSYEQMLLAQDLARNQQTDSTIIQFSLWGVMLPVIHAAAFWFGDQFFLTLQPAFAFSLIGVFGYMVYISLNGSANRRRWLTGFAVLLLGSNYFILFQAVYIHNSMLAAAYLLPAVTLLWRAHVENNPNALYAALFFLFGFAFTRTESVMFAALFIIIAWGTNQFSPRVWQRALLPYAILLVAWHIWLLTIVPAEGDILSTNRVLILIATVAGPFLGSFALQLQLRFDKLLLSMLTAAFVAAVLFNPNHMLLSTFNSISNLLRDGFAWWGIIWYFALGLLIVLRPKRSVSFGRILAYGIIAFFLLTWLLGSQRIPYRLGWADSSNRMFTHILPIVLFYLQIRFGRWIEGKFDR